jgi:ribose 1,5-bisphosphokinase PhnN
MGDTDDPIAGFSEMLRRLPEDAKSSPADVIAADTADPLREDEFDSALWSALCGRLDAGAEFAEWPREVQAYFATRYIDWEVMNGGFRQALVNESREYLPAAIAGYDLLGRPELAALLRRALTTPDAASLEALDEQFGVNDAERVAYVRAHAKKFQL